MTEVTIYVYPVLWRFDCPYCRTHESATNLFDLAYENHIRCYTNDTRNRLTAIKAGYGDVYSFMASCVYSIGETAVELKWGERFTTTWAVAS